MDTYLLLKILHLIGVVVITGNFIITRFWKIAADRTGNYDVITFAQKHVIKADYFFTFGGLLILLVAGMLNSFLNGPSFHGTSWILWAYWIFILAILIWIFAVIPIQKKQKKLLLLFLQEKTVPQDYRELCQKWNLLSVIILLLLITSISWMVLKPDVEWVFSGTFF